VLTAVFATGLIVNRSNSAIIMNRFIRLLLSAGLVVAAIVCLGNLVAGAKEAAGDKTMPPASIRFDRRIKVKAADLPGLAKISFEQALKVAVGAAPGGVIKGELEVKDGNLVYSFEVAGADRMITALEIDAGDGKVLATEKKSGGYGEAFD